MCNLILYFQRHSRDPGGKKGKIANCPIVVISVAEPEPQGGASFGRSLGRSRNAMRLRL
jgi:hypothetical protein